MIDVDGFTVGRGNGVICVFIGLLYILPMKRFGRVGKYEFLEGNEILQRSIQILSVGSINFDLGWNEYEIPTKQVNFPQESSKHSKFWPSNHNFVSGLSS